MRTSVWTGVLVGVLAAVLAAPASSTGQETAGQAPKDVRGWRGTEWGATPEQVATTIGLPLGEPQQDPKDKAVTHYKIPHFSVGAWVVELSLSFQGSDRPGLSGVGLNLGDHDFKSVADELKGNYGPPTSEKRERVGGVLIETATWLFPSTEIRCTRMEIPAYANKPTEAFLTVLYGPRRKSPF